MSGSSLVRLVVCVVLCVGVGLVAGLVTYPQIPTWYAGLAKPWWTPPSWAFPVVWNILYVMMAVSLWLMWDRGPNALERRSAIRLFFLQLCLNAAWTPVFFGLHLPRVALAVIILLALAIVATMLAAARVNRTAAWLLAPYLAWVIYASTLNAGFVALNP